jgi:hypothetical protein
MIAAMTMPMINETGLAAGGAFGGVVGGVFTGGGAIVELMEFSPMSANAWQAFPRGFSVQMTKASGNRERRIEERGEFPKFHWYS